MSNFGSTGCVNCLTENSRIGFNDFKREVKVWLNSKVSEKVERIFNIYMCLVNVCKNEYPATINKPNICSYEYVKIETQTFTSSATGTYTHLCDELWMFAIPGMAMQTIKNNIGVFILLTVARAVNICYSKTLPVYSIDYNLCKYKVKCLCSIVI